MVELVTRKRIEILVDAPLADWLVSEADHAGLTHYTLLPVLSGRGRMGGWRDEDLSGAIAKRMFVSITTPERAQVLIDALAVRLDEYGLMLSLSDVSVVRGERF